MKTILFAFIAILCASPAFAALSISGATGSFSNLSSVTVTGSGFGATGPTVRLFDDFEKGTNGNVINQALAEVGTWDALSSTSRVTYNNTYKRGSLAMITDQTVASTNKMVAVITGTDPEVFVSWWQLIPTTDVMPGADNVDGVNWKMSWFIRGDTSGAPGESDQVVYVLLPGPGVNASSNSDFGGHGWVPNTDPPNDFIAGRWTRMWTYVKSATDATGAFDSWFLQQGRTPTHAFNLTNVVTEASTAAGPYNRFDFPGYTRTTASRPVYDDIYIASGAGARARLEIGDNATYTSCTDLAVLTVTSWADNSVTATVRLGDFTPGTSAYVFAIDAAGNVSPGYAVTIGAGGGGGSHDDITPPVTSSDVPAGHYQTSQTVTLSANETATTSYCIGQGCTPNITYSAPFKVLQNAHLQYLRYSSVDTSSNQETTKEIILKKQKRR